MFVTDFHEIAKGAEEEFGIKMYIDLIFSEELNKYFNYKYDYENDIITLNFEVDDGSASLDIVNAQSPDFSYRMNDVLTKYIEETGVHYC